MKDAIEKVRAFNNKHGVRHSDNLDIKFNLDLRMTLIREEYGELWDAFAFVDKDCPAYYTQVQVAKEMADLIYVIIGAALVWGIDLDAVFTAVHESNMTKTGDKRGDGKILKGPDYVPPDIKKVLGL